MTEWWADRTAQGLATLTIVVAFSLVRWWKYRHRRNPDPRELAPMSVEWRSAKERHRLEHR